MERLHKLFIQYYTNMPQSISVRGRLLISLAVSLAINFLLIALIGNPPHVPVCPQENIVPTQLNVVDVELTKTFDAPVKKTTREKVKTRRAASQPDLSPPALELPKNSDFSERLHLPQVFGDNTIQLSYSMPQIEAAAAPLGNPVEAIISDGSQNSGPMLIEPPDLSAYYPYSARKKRITGTSVIQLVVAADGAVNQVSVVSSSPSGVFEQAASRLGFSLLFRAARRDGKPLAVRTRLKLNWTLD